VGGGGVTGAGIAARTFTISANHYNTIPAIGRANYLQDLLLNSCTKFTRNTTLPALRHFALNTSHFAHILVMTKIGKILIFNTTFLCTSYILQQAIHSTSLRTLPLMKLLVNQTFHFWLVNFIRCGIVLNSIMITSSDLQKLFLCLKFKNVQTLTL
jgi:hypothetical protein